MVYFEMEVVVWVLGWSEVVVSRVGIVLESRFFCFFY